MAGLVAADEPVDVPDEPDDSSEPDEPEVEVEPVVLWVLVPLGTVLLPAPEPEEGVPTAPPVGPAAPPPTTEDTRVVPLTAAGMP